MFIKSLKIDNLYGKNYSIQFDKNLVILYGLNGSGKTTVLNILYSILEGDISSTLVYKYESLTLVMVKDGKTEEVKISFNAEVELYEINLNGRVIGMYDFNGNDRFFSGDTYVNGRGRLHSHEGHNTYTDRTWDSNRNISPHYSSINSNPVYRRNSQIPKRELMKLSKIFRNELVYVPLDRKVKGIESKLNRFNRSVVTTNKKNIENSLGIAEDYYKEYLRYISQKEIIIHEDMRIKILTELSKPQLNLIDHSMKSTENDFKSLIKELSDPIFRELKENVIELNTIYQNKDRLSLLSKGKLNFQETSDYFDYMYATAQLKNLHSVVEKVKPLKRAIDDLKEKSNSVINSINELFKETDKKIIYDRREGEFSFSPVKKNEKISLNHLSSGEKQLIMFYIFSIIKFDKNDTKILFIDEPELSLHIDWQSKLLPSIVEKGDNTQIIVATHSPDIIGDFVSNTVQIKGELI